MEDRPASTLVQWLFIHSQALVGRVRTGTRYLKARLGLRGWQGRGVIWAAFHEQKVTHLWLLLTAAQVEVQGVVVLGVAP